MTIVCLIIKQICVHFYKNNHSSYITRSGVLKFCMDVSLSIINMQGFFQICARFQSEAMTSHVTYCPIIEARKPMEFR